MHLLGGHGVDGITKVKGFLGSTTLVLAGCERKVHLGSGGECGMAKHEYAGRYRAPPPLATI